MKVAVLKGGRSLERAVSLRSGARVEDALGELGHEVVAIDADESLVATLKDERPDVAFIALHGPGGEDGTVQSLLELLGVPYTGPGVAACVLCMDKVQSKHRMRASGIPTPDWVAFGAAAFRELGAADAIAEVERSLGLPLVVKPAAQGSALGVRFAGSAGDVPQALVAALSYDDRVLIERHVDGRELAVSIVDGEPLPIVEAIPEREDEFNYEARYEIGRTRYACPAELERRRGERRPRRRRRDLGGARLRRLRPRRRDARPGRGPPGARGQLDPGPDRHVASADGRRGGGDELRALRRAGAGAGDRQESRLVSEAPGEIDVRDIRAGEEGAAAAVLGRGMRDNPLHFAAYGADADRRERIHTRVSSFVLEKMSAQEPLVAVDDGVIVGVAGAMALGRCQPDVAEQVKMFPALAGLGPRTGLRVVRWTAEWSKHDPAEPHVHLGPVGVDRHLQGRGIGSG